METSYSIQESLPEKFIVGFPSSLFNQEVHRMAQQKIGWQSYYLLDEKKKRAVAAVHFCIREGVAYSPVSAPYGSFEFSPHLPSKIVYGFIVNCELLLKEKKVCKISIQGAPQLDSTSTHHMTGVFLLNQKYAISKATLHAFILMNENSFDTKIATWEKKKLHRCIKNGLRFQHLPLHNLEKVYHFIATCRAERGKTLSMTLPSLQQTVEQCADFFFLFVVYHGTDLVAASISIRPQPDMLYNFYPAHALRANSLSPVVMLVEGIYNWCKKNNITNLDLGSSAQEEHPHFSLLDFKLRLGAVPIMKLTFEKKI